MTRAALFVTGLLTAFSAAAQEQPSPLQSQVDAAAPGQTIMLTGGHYGGLLHLSRPLILVGAGLGETTLENVRGLAVVVDSPGVELRNMTVVGLTAVVVRPGASLIASGIDLWGTGEVFRVEPGGKATLSNGTATCDGKSERSLGSSILGTLEATDFHWTGPCYRSLHVKGGSAILRRIVVEGATETGVHLLDATVDIDGLRAALSNRDGAVLFGGNCKLKVRDATLTGGLEGFLLRGGRVDASGVVIHGSINVGMAMNKTEMIADHLSFDGPFYQAALLVEEQSRFTGKDLLIQHAGSAGILVLRAEALVTATRIVGGRLDKEGDFGHGVFVEEGAATLEDLTVDDSQGAGLYVSNPRSHAVVQKANLSRVGVGVSVAHGAKVHASHVTVSESGAGVAVIEGAGLLLDDSSIQASIGALDTDDAHLELNRVAVTAAIPKRRCKEDELDSLLREALSKPTWRSQ